MISLLCKRAQLLLARVLREESGSAAVNVVFFLIGGIALTAFVVDATRVSADGARLKQATDAAAQAVAMEAAKDSETDVLGMAQRYVAVNLGLDKEQLSRDLSVAVEPVTWNDYEGYRVSASFRASMFGTMPRVFRVFAAGRCRIELSRSGSAISNRGRVSLIWPLPICPMSARRFFMFVGECAAGNSSIGLNRREDLLKSALKPVTAATALCRTIPAGGPTSRGGDR